MSMPPVQKKPRERRRTFLRNWRKHRRLSQEDAAAKIGVDRSTISRIESGASPYDQDFLERAATVYECEIEDLLCHDPKSIDVSQEIYTRLRRATPELQKKAIDILDVLLRGE